MENKDWREDEFKMWFLDNCTIMSDLDGRAHNVMKFNTIKLYIESLLKSKQEEIEKVKFTICDEDEGTKQEVVGLDDIINILK